MNISGLIRPERHGLRHLDAVSLRYVVNGASAVLLRAILCAWFLPRYFDNGCEGWNAEHTVGLRGLNQKDRLDVDVCWPNGLCHIPSVPMDIWTSNHVPGKDRIQDEMRTCRYDVT